MRSYGRPKTALFLVAILTFTGFSTYLILGMINFQGSNRLAAIFWTGGFVILTFNVGMQLVCGIFGIFFKFPRLKEKSVGLLSRTAIVYVVKNEDENELLENMDFSFSNNALENVDLWLLSNSDSASFICAEQKLIQRLKNRYGCERINYFRSLNNPMGRKHVCIQEWLRAHKDYEYFVVCDADSRLPAQSVKKLLEKAHHEENRDVVVFQSQINVYGSKTAYASLLEAMQSFGQKIYIAAYQLVFGRSIFFGSGALIRCKEFNQISVPEWVLSHDIWDTAFLAENGHRVAFCGDVVTLGKFPANYVEYIKRSARWAKGTLESGKLLTEKRVPFSVKFMIFYPIYGYLIQPFFLIWIFSGFFLDNKAFEPFLTAQRYTLLGAKCFDLEMGSHFFMTMAIVFGHSFSRCRSIKGVVGVLRGLMISVLIGLNSVYFDSEAVLKWLLRKRGKAAEWIPMKKRGNENLTFMEAMRKLWPTTLIGFAFIYLGILYAPNWTLVASPFLVSFSLCIPLTYLTGRSLKTRKKQSEDIMLMSEVS